MTKINQPALRELASLFGQINSRKLMQDLLVDILTPKELAEVVMRWQLIKMLAAGVPQRAIAKKLGISIAKITRGSRALQNEKGGFNQVLKRTLKN